MLDLPVSAAWRHLDARSGFEVVFPRSEGAAPRFDGHVSAVEAGQAWAVSYTIALDSGWRCRGARIISRSAMGTRELELRRVTNGDWLVNGVPATQVAGCDDIDLAASTLTNAFPVHRLRLDAGRSAQAPALYVRAPALRVERLEQTYRRIADDGARARYEYSAPRFEFEAVLDYDSAGLILHYPGLAERVL